FFQIDQPCIPCIGECSRFGCEIGCNTAQSVQKTFTLSNITLPSKTLTVNETGHESQQIISYYLTVRSITGSGHIAVASSNGFYVDDTPPVFDPDVMTNGFFYYDVGQGENTPVKFQQSNDTIKCIWKCEDKESGIVENFWAIGTTPGETDIQNFTSTGQNITGVNSKLGGVLKDNQTYYASFTCTNGAGLNATFIDTGGVIVKLIPPEVDMINTTIPGTSHFTEEVNPKDSLQQQDPTSIGFTFTKSEDPSVNRYDLCVGSEVETDDIFPCTWVGYNMSGSAEIKNGSLWIDGNEVRKLSELKRYQDFTNITNSSSNSFTMPVGQQMFVTLRLCNEAMLCNNKSLGVVVITNSNSVVATSTNGSAIEEKLSITRRKRALAEVDIRTPSGLPDGQAIIVTKLSAPDLTKDYRSDASIDFVSYIQNPATSMDMVDRLLYKRFYGQSFAFSVAPLGNVPMPGPMVITYPDSVGHVTTGNRTMLLHWNPVMQYWEISSRTCKHLPPEEQEVYDAIKQTMAVKVCNTWAKNDNDKSKESRKRRSTTETINYFGKETMFILSITKASIQNSAPKLDSQTEVLIKEDSGTLHYKLSAADEEGDHIIFSLLNQTLTGDVFLSDNGYLVYTPCVDCSGDERIDILLIENQTNPDIPVASTKVAINIHIQPVNDFPTVFLTLNGSSLLSKDPTEDVIVLLEAINDFTTNETGLWKARVGAYDVEKSDTLKLIIFNPFNLSISVTGENKQVPHFSADCNRTDIFTPTMMPCADFSRKLPHAASDLTWLTYIVQFTQPRNQFGNYTFSFYFEDSSNGTSPPVNIKFGIMEMPCHNSGTCQAAGIYPCKDTHRTHSFDAYYRCQCTGGYQGTYCTEDINECLSDPCEPPFVCYNNQNSYHCACPSDNPNCEIVTWMIVVSVFIVIFILVLIGVAVYRYRTQRMKKYVLNFIDSQFMIARKMTFPWYICILLFITCILFCRRSSSETSVPSILDQNQDEFTESEEELEHPLQAGENINHFNVQPPFPDQQKNVFRAVSLSEDICQPKPGHEYSNQDLSKCEFVNQAFDEEDDSFSEEEEDDSQDIPRDEYDNQAYSEDEDGSQGFPEDEDSAEQVENGRYDEGDEDTDISVMEDDLSFVHPPPVPEEGVFWAFAQNKGACQLFANKESEDHADAPSDDETIFDNDDDDIETSFIEDDESFVHPPPNVNYPTHAVEIDDKSFVHPPPNFNYHSEIEMQNMKKFYQRHTKTTFKPLVPAVYDQNQSSQNRGLTPRLRGRQTGRSPSRVLSAGPSGRKHIGENLPISPKGKEKRKTTMDGRLHSPIAAEAESKTENKTQGPVDPDQVNSEPAQLCVFVEDTSDEQSV
ncbi:uncharacterized protein LOC134251189, partial [Saccostrea cucullata]|uniref:uncharacterized protein LOC134251189 n=1 Tax=Saccostrea cuccullata TaxID=36930 RepID=UPI002ED60B9B